MPGTRSLLCRPLLDEVGLNGESAMNKGVFSSLVR